MKRIIAFFVLLFIITGNRVVSQVTVLSSNPMKKNQVLTYAAFQYFKTHDKYDWTDNKFHPIPDANRVGNLSLLAMVGYGLTNNFALYLQYPVYDQVKNSEHNFYDGEAVLMGRYAIIPSSSDKTGLTLIGAVEFPTTFVEDNPYASSSVDFIFGEIMSTAWYHNCRTHVKSEYSVNRKGSGDENPGDEFRIIIKQDFKLWKIKIFLINQYQYQFVDRNEENQVIENTQKQRLLHLLGAEYVLKDIHLRPKFQMFSVGQGGSVFRGKFIFDLYYYF